MFWREGFLAAIPSSVMTIHDHGRWPPIADGRSSNSPNNSTESEGGISDINSQYRRGADAIAQHFFQAAPL
jgi:hypothetical protein